VKRLVVEQNGHYIVTIEVRRPQGAWEDISLRSDQGLAPQNASLSYRLRLTEEHAQVIE